MLVIDEHDPRLSKHDVQFLRSLQLRLRGMTLPDKYRELANKHFTSPCSEDGDLELRGEG